MVRINLIDPKHLLDQHLIAEYNEILMLLGYVRKYPLVESILGSYCLGEGHIKFFKNKLGYLKARHEVLRIEMQQRGFRPTKRVNLDMFEKRLINNWQPQEKDFSIIKKRLLTKIKKKPTFYNYYGQKKPLSFMVNLIQGA